MFSFLFHLQALLHIQDISDDSIILAGELLVDLADLLLGDELNGRLDVVLVTEINAILSLLNATNDAAGQGGTSVDKVALSYLKIIEHP